ncbi:MAG: DeoR/GlpR family DNA-binding transcription regulator [Paracoccaceae bacterium]|nr:DeoR/GlpR family DNA-binding transcription regulator [Paracoccaceae bacterium]
MKPRDRQDRILQIVRRDGSASVEALAETFAVSVETVRRDLHDLASTGALHKVRGGARRIRLATEGSFEERRMEQAGAKAAIARTLAAAIAPGDTIFLDTGTTTLACAEELARIDGLTVITNSFRIAQRLGGSGGTSARDGARVFVLGGAWSADNAETVGPMAIEQIGRFQADHAVLGVAAIDAEAGAMDADFDEAQIAHAMIGHARHVIVLAHAEKHGRRAAFRVCRLDEIDVLVSDRQPEGHLAAALGRARVEVRCRGAGGA